MLFTIVILAVLVATFLVVKNKKKVKIENSCCVHQPLEEINVPTMVEEPQPVEVETVPTVKVVPTTPPSAPTMAAKKKKKPAKKKPAKTNA